MNRVSRVSKDYIELDKNSINGAFTVPSIKKIDMLELRKYCKSGKIKYSDLTEKEINKFEK